MTIHSDYLGRGGDLCGLSGVVGMWRCCRPRVLRLIPNKMISAFNSSQHHHPLLTCRSLKMAALFEIKCGNITRGRFVICDDYCYA